MPGWHKAIGELVKANKVKLVGVIQEQHPDRCKLFAQWQQFDWPILHDPINKIPTTAVPVAIAIDEHGVVRKIRPRPDWVINEFLKTEYATPKMRKAVVAKKPDIKQLNAMAVKQSTAQNWQAVAEAETIWGSPHTAVAGWDAVIKASPKNAPAHFARGVALRMRWESKQRQGSDFQDAVNSWSRALEINPNHYIYRRRIQQYGSRLIKPYPFYDWVNRARAEITKRGEKPVQLAVEPGGAEIAQPARSFKAATTAKEPDAAGKINRDKNLLEATIVAVPLVPTRGETVRFHIDLRPTKSAHWNNEAEPVEIWINQPEGWELSQRHFKLEQPKTAESHEPRRLEFEAKLPTDAKDTTLKGYALFYVCEEEGGQCLYLRKDISIPVTTKAPRKRRRR